MNIYDTTGIAYEDLMGWLNASPQAKGHSWSTVWFEHRRRYWVDEEAYNTLREPLQDELEITGVMVLPSPEEVLTSNWEHARKEIAAATATILEKWGLPPLATQPEAWEAAIRLALHPEENDEEKIT